MKLLPRFLFLLLAVFFIALPLAAQESVFGSLQWSIRGSILLFPEDNGNASAPMPILPALGGSAAYPISNLLALELSLDLYGTTYDYDYSLGRAVPANDEFRSAFVTGILVGIQPVFRFRPMGDKFTIRVYGGLGFDFRAVFRAYGIEDDEQHTNNQNPNTGHTVGEARKEISSYFWGGGRFFFPFAGVGMDFPVLETMQLGFDLRAWFPLWRVWTGEGLPAIEGFRFGAGFRLSIKN